MNYTYTINKILPKSEFMSVTYSADGYPDYKRNFNPTDFSQEYISQMIENFAPHVVEFWERQLGHPEEVVIAGGSAEAFSTAAGMHIDPGQTIYVDLAPNDELWATSTPNGLEVQVLDMRRND